MKSFLIFFFLVSAFCKTNSQPSTYQKPDYDLIKIEIMDSSSTFYYPKLVTRLAAYDTTLNLEDYRYLYYGYIYQNEYQPYWTSPDEEKLMKFYKSSKIRENDYDEIIQLATHSINEFPFDLRQMNYLAYIYHLKGNEEMAKKVSFRFQMTMEAILSSGDGTTCESGYHVISVSHEYVFLNMFEFRMTLQTLTGDCDYLTLVKDQRNIEGIYFNIQKLFQKNLENIKGK